MKASQYYRKFAIWQWNIFAALVLIVLCVIAWKALMPLGKQVYASAITVCNNWSVLSKSDSIASLPELTRNRADEIDSCLRKISYSQNISEQAIPGMIYALANGAGIKASKVEIGKKTMTDQGMQIPVGFRAAGDYTSCGKFVDGVETMQPAARISELSMKSSGGGDVDLFADFILMAQQ